MVIPLKTWCMVPWGFASLGGPSYSSNMMGIFGKTAGEVYLNCGEPSISQEVVFDIMFFLKKTVIQRSEISALCYQNRDFLIFFRCFTIKNSPVLQ